MVGQERIAPLKVLFDDLDTDQNRSVVQALGYMRHRSLLRKGRVGHKLLIKVTLVLLSDQKPYFLEGMGRILVVINYESLVENLDEARALCKLDPTQRQTVDKGNVLLLSGLARVVCSTHYRELFIFRLFTDHKVEQRIAEREYVFALGHLKMASPTFARSVRVHQPGSEGSDLESGV